MMSDSNSHSFGMRRTSYPRLNKNLSFLFACVLRSLPQWFIVSISIHKFLLAIKKSIMNGPIGYWNVYSIRYLSNISRKRISCGQGFDRNVSDIDLDIFSLIPGIWDGLFFFILVLVLLAQTEVFLFSPYAQCPFPLLAVFAIAASLLFLKIKPRDLPKRYIVSLETLRASLIFRTDSFCSKCILFICSKFNSIHVHLYCRSAIL